MIKQRRNIKSEANVNRLVAKVGEFDKNSKSSLNSNTYGSRKTSRSKKNMNRDMKKELPNQGDHDSILQSAQSSIFDIQRVQQKLPKKRVI